MMKWACRIRGFFLFIFVSVFTLISSVITLVIVAPLLPQNYCDAWIRFWARTILRFSGTRLHVSGLENFKDVQSCILVSNHSSHFDIPILFATLPISFRMVAKMELFHIPVFGRALRSLGFVPVLRDNSEAGLKVFKEMDQKFTSGQSVWMAPEGTRFPGMGIGPFKTGAFYVALRVGRPIVPVCIYGTHKVLGKNSLMINGDSWTRDVHVHVLPPVSILKEDSRSRRDLSNEVRKQLVDEFSRIHRSSGDHDPLTLVEDSSVSQNLT